MIQGTRRFVAPGYLLLCLLLGGSAQGVWGNALLRLLAIILIAWALLSRRERPISPAIRQLMWLIGLAIALALLQLVPIPMTLWAKLPGRAEFLEGFQLLGAQPRALPLSLAPYETFAALLALLPPLGMLAATVGLRSYSRAWLAAALIFGAVGGVLLGILQVTSADMLHSPWYLYRQSNYGVATGFFANGNHMASLLLVTVPFIAALGGFVRENAKDARFRSAVLALVGGGLIVIILGLILNGSLAGYGLGIPVVLASLLMLFGTKTKIARLGLTLIGVTSLVGIALLWASSVNPGTETSVASRQLIFENSVDLLGDFGTVGTGLGTFPQVYRLSERPDAVDRYYVNHAHDDYLELAIETGLPGVMLMLLFLAWWIRAVRSTLKDAAADQFAYAGAIASAALLLHSLVDYPLRTAAMSAVFAMCLALILQSRRVAGSASDLRPARHLELR